MRLPQEYIIIKFYQYAGYARYKKVSNIYEGGCPICREGRSWGRKRRLYYIVDNNAICCHNCGWYSQPLKWLLEVSDLSYNDVQSEIKTHDYDYVDVLAEKKEAPVSVEVDKLPKDSINLFDTHQLRYHNDNRVVKDCLDIIAKRRLDIAINKPKTLWLSLTDFIHKNRIIIPFYDENNNMVHYQSREVYPDNNKPKYLSKVNSTKSLFNINQIDSSLDDIFIFEGPIDSFFTKNSVAIAGIQENSDKTLSQLQDIQLKKLWMYNKIWVLDSQWQDHASYSKTKRLLDQGATVFIWPRNIGTTYKDFNDMTTALSIDEISNKFIAKHSYSKLKGKAEFLKVKPLQR